MKYDSIVCVATILFTALCITGLAHADAKLGTQGLHRAKLLQLNGAGKIEASTSRVMISTKELSVSEKLQFPDQLVAHANLVEKVVEVQKQAHANQQWAIKRKDPTEIAAAIADIENNRKAVFPYALAKERAAAMMAQGYKLRDLSGNMCKGDSCSPIDAQVAMYFFTRDRVGLSGELKSPRVGQNTVIQNRVGGLQRVMWAADQPMSDKGDDSNPDRVCSDGKNCSICINGFNICNFIDFVSGTPLDDITAGYWPKIREGVLNNENGEIAQLIRDPGRRMLEIVQNWRDHVIRPNDNGEIAKIIRDPIKCSIGHLWGGCTQ